MSVISYDGYMYLSTLLDFDYFYSHFSLIIFDLYPEISVLRVYFRLHPFLSIPLQGYQKHEFWCKTTIPTQLRCHEEFCCTSHFQQPADRNWHRIRAELVGRCFLPFSAIFFSQLVVPRDDEI